MQNPRTRPVAGVAAALGVILALLGVPACGDGGAALQRDLSEWRADQLPAWLPPSWRAQLEEVAADAPRMSLLDPHAAEVVRDLLVRVPWVDPASVEVRHALPEGLRVTFRPRAPRLMLVRGEEPVAMLARDGTVLPPMTEAAARRVFLQVPVDPDLALPAPGRKVADALLQEALDASEEALTVRRETGLPVRWIRRQADYPRHARGVPPALAFVLADGREIHWGRSAATREPHGISLEEKGLRLQAVLARYPDLAGVARVVLDFPRVRVVGMDGEELPLPEALR